MSHIFTSLFYKTPLNLTALTFALLVSGCESVSDLTSTLNPMSKSIVLECPVEKILPDANKLTAFKQGGGKDLVDIDHEVALQEVFLTCYTDADEETRIGKMKVEVVNSFQVKRGPANIQKTASIPYFIAVTDQSRNILYREKFVLLVPFSGNQTQVLSKNNPVTLILPLTPELTGTSYRIYSGIELTEEQLLYNRQH